MENVYQKLFDKALNGIRKQGKPSMRGGGCALRGAMGRKCSIGQLISDRDYPEDELIGLDKGGSVISNLPILLKKRILGLSNRVQVVSKKYKDGEEFLCELQHAHDERSTSPISSWKSSFEDRMQKIANKYNLSYKKPRARK